MGLWGGIEDFSSQIEEGGLRTVGRGLCHNKRLRALTPPVADLKPATRVGVTARTSGAATVMYISAIV